jgi:hypothetical protein
MQLVDRSLAGVHVLPADQRSEITWFVFAYVPPEGVTAWPPCSHILPCESVATAGSDREYGSAVAVGRPFTDWSVSNTMFSLYVPELPWSQVIVSL